MRQQEQMSQDTVVNGFQQAEEFEQKIKHAILSQREESRFCKSLQAIYDTDQPHFFNEMDEQADTSMLELKLVLDILSWETTEVEDTEASLEEENQLYRMIL